MDSDANFAELMEECALPVHAYIQSHDNWDQFGSGGFLPVPPGCPALLYDDPTLDDEGYRWTCVDF